MRLAGRMLSLLVALVLLSACKSPLQLYATRHADMREDNAPRLRAFESGEKPAIVVDLPNGCGWGEKTGTVWIDQAISGRTVWKQSQFMQEGYTHYFVPEGLKRGSYVVTLRSEGEAKASITFDVQ
jgi:hypothetical protein